MTATAPIWTTDVPFKSQLDALIEFAACMRWHWIDESRGLFRFEKGLATLHIRIVADEHSTWEVIGI